MRRSTSQASVGTSSRAWLGTASDLVACWECGLPRTSLLVLQPACPSQQLLSALWGIGVVCTSRDAKIALAVLCFWRQPARWELGGQCIGWESLICVSLVPWRARCTGDALHSIKFRPVAARLPGRQARVCMRWHAVSGCRFSAARCGQWLISCLGRSGCELVTLDVLKHLLGFPSAARCHCLYKSRHTCVRYPENTIQVYDKYITFLAIGQVIVRLCDWGAIAETVGNSATHPETTLKFQSDLLEIISDCADDFKHIVKVMVLVSLVGCLVYLLWLIFVYLLGVSLGFQVILGRPWDHK